MRHRKPIRLVRNKRGLGEAISALIIVVASVLLSTIVILFAVNVTASQVQKEKLFVASSHIWYVNSTTSIAALGISNVGSTDSVLTKITVNGLQCNWNGTSNYVVCSKINGAFPGDMSFVGDMSNVGDTKIAIAGLQYTFTPASSGLTVKSGDSIAFYMVVPNCILIQDVSMPADIILTTTQAVYCTENNVQSA